MSNQKVTISYAWSESVTIKVRCKANKSFGICEVTLLKFKSNELTMAQLDRLNDLVFHKVIGRDIRLVSEVIKGELNLRKANMERYGNF